MAFSGGLDSTVLLHLLTQLVPAHPGAPALMAVHINHGMQAEADELAGALPVVCASLGVALLARLCG